MCRFLSLVESDRHAFCLFTPEQRIEHSRKPLTDKHGNAYEMDSHASICAFYGLDEDAVNKYEWDPYTRKLDVDQKVFDVDEARVQAYLDGIDWHPICGDIEGLRAFCERMKDVPFLERSGSLPEGVKLFTKMAAAMAAARDAARGAARDAARDAAWYAARDAAWDAARDAAMAAARDAARGAAWGAARDAAGDAAKYAAWSAAGDAASYAEIVFLCAGLPLDAKHVEYIKKRWSVWEAVDGVLCDVDGVLYCYEKP